MLIDEALRALLQCVLGLPILNRIWRVHLNQQRVYAIKVVECIRVTRCHRRIEFPVSNVSRPVSR